MKVSYIVPVYNAEKYLTNCVESIMNLPSRDIEIILVNDGSTDNSGKICDDLSKSDDRVKVCHIKNVGVSGARNYGMSIAEGDYIRFVDSDDRINYMNTQLDIKSQSDVYVFSASVVDENDKLLSMVTPGKNRITNPKAVLSNLDIKSKETTFHYIWNHLYKKSIIDKYDIKFNEEVNLGEDFLFNLEYMKYCGNIEYSTANLYTYYKRKNSSLTHVFYKDELILRRLMDKSLTEIYRYFDIYEENREKLCEIIGSMAVNSIYKAIRLDVNIKIFITYLSQFLNSEYYECILKYYGYGKMGSIFKKIEYLFYKKKNPRLLYIIYKIKYKYSQCLNNRKKRKVEIITITSLNYGNRLQNYALQEVLQTLGCDVVTGRQKPYAMYRKILNILYRLRGKTKYDMFMRFDKRIRWNNKFPIKDNPNIDYYIAGSDQIWNPNFDFNSDREFLTFTEKKKRIAYAGSIGAEELTDKAKYTKLFGGFSQLSVREDSAQKIIENLTGQTVPVMADPALILPETEWDNVAESAKCNVKEKYVLTYFLGNVNPKYGEYIKKTAEKSRYTIINIGIGKNNRFEAGPAEFVYLIKNAEMIYTDSFHALVFSAIFKKNVLVFERVDANGNKVMNSRIETLISKLNLSVPIVKDIADLPPGKTNITYSGVDEIIKKERWRALDFLNGAFSQEV